MRITTLNVQNLRLRKTGEQDRLQGAWDSDDPEDQGFDPIDRRLTAELLCDINPDIVALQEVFDLETLDYFHATYFLPTGAQPYPHRICLPGNDGRGLDVALMSRQQISAVRSHASLTLTEAGIDPPSGIDPSLPVFRRDCLEARVGPLTLFISHFKSPYPDASAAWTTRRLEALATRHLVEQKFEKPAAGLWLILGDLNEPNSTEIGSERAIAPLETEFAEDLMLRLPKSERWTYYDPHSGQYHCPDALLASPALARLCPEAKPIVVRKGLGTEVLRYRGRRLSDVGAHRPHASDHAAVAIDLPGLETIAR